MYTISATINTTKLKTETHHLNDLKGEQVLQLVHKDSSEIKIVLTQEFFLSLVNDAMRARYILDGVQPEASEQSTVSPDEQKAKALERARYRAALRREDSANC